MSTTNIWRIRARWSKEATFLVKATTGEAARDYLKRRADTEGLDIADSESGITDYFHVFKTFPVHDEKNPTGHGRKPIPEGATIFVDEAAPAQSRESRLAEIRLAARSR